MGIQIIRTDDPLSDAAVLAVRDRLRGGEVTGRGEGHMHVPSVVAEVIRRVGIDGDAAVAEMTEEFDSVTLKPGQFRVPPEAIAAARSAADPSFLALVRRVVANIRSYQESVLHRDSEWLVRGGRRLGLRYTPIDRVGVYVPGGRAAYPSTVLMTVVPAQVAGVREIVIASPPKAGGEVNPLVLALAGELGVGEVYRIGGAQAVAALAIGTASIRAADKIVGPGNAFVTEAKRQLLGRVGIDSMAGPSEVLIVADETARPEWVAADLLAQAEHDPGSAVLVTTSAGLAEAVAAECDKQLTGLERAEAIRAALDEYSAIIVVGDMDAACAAANDFATEHLQIVTADDEAVLAKIRHAGAIFLGAHTPVPLGDYYAGPSHVLPTGGTARFFGPLSCNDFLKASSVICYDSAAAAEDADDVIDFATREGLTAHAKAMELRKEQ